MRTRAGRIQSWPRRAASGLDLSPYYVTTVGGIYSTKDFSSYKLVNSEILNVSIVVAKDIGVIACLKSSGAHLDTVHYSTNGGRSFSSVTLNSAADGVIATDGASIVVTFTDGRVFKSTNGVDYTLVATVAFGGGGPSFSFVNGYWFVYVRNTGGTAAFYSTDAINWTSTTGPFPSAGSSYINPGSSAVWDGSKYLISGYDYNVGSYKLWIGKASAINSWDAQANIQGNNSVAYTIAATSSLAICAGLYNAVSCYWYSTDHGATWTRVDLAFGGGAVARVFEFAGVFFLVAANEIHTTTDGTTLTRVDDGTLPNITHIASSL